MKRASRVLSVKPAVIVIRGEKVLCDVRIELINLEIVPLDDREIFSIDHVEVVVQKKEPPFTIYAMRKGGHEMNLPLLERVGSLVAAALSETVQIVSRSN